MVETFFGGSLSMTGDRGIPVKTWSRVAFDRMGGDPVWRPTRGKDVDVPTECYAFGQILGVRAMAGTHLQQVGVQVIEASASRIVQRGHCIPSMTVAKDVSSLGVASSRPWMTEHLAFLEANFPGRELPSLSVCLTRRVTYFIEFVTLPELGSISARQGFASAG